MASRSRRSSQPVSTPSTICSAAGSITRRRSYHGAPENVGRVLEHYEVRFRRREVHIALPQGATPSTFHLRDVFPIDGQIADETTLLGRIGKRKREQSIAVIGGEGGAVHARALIDVVVGERLYVLRVEDRHLWLGKTPADAAESRS